MPAIDVSDIRKKFGDVTALAGVTFSVAKGSLFGLIGADGAGKTTLLRILVTLLAPDAGGAAVLGKSVVTDFAAIRALVGYMPQKFSLYGDLSVGENLRFFADVFGVPPTERAARTEKLLSFSRLAPFVNRRAAALSGGMKQKLALSCALIHTPRLLILDEPTTGVDPVSRKEFWDILFDLKKQGITILVSTPYMDEATLCDSLLLLHKGSVLRQGAPSSLLAAYPLTLFRVAGSAGSVNVRQGTPLPRGVKLMYPAAGALHVAAAPGAAAAPEILAQVKKHAPAAETIEKAAPAIEDLFFYLLSEQGAA
jgi:ABC-2 type transport system ATP-binding protein